MTSTPPLPRGKIAKLGLATLPAFALMKLAIAPALAVDSVKSLDATVPIFYHSVFFLG